METIEIHSKSFVIKWIQIPNDTTLTFQLKPLKKSINFGIYKSNNSNSNSNLITGTNQDQLLQRKRSNSIFKISLEERLKQSNLIKVKDYGIIQGNQLFTNDLKIKQGGIFALIFDNSFSKSNSKQILFNKFFRESFKPLQRNQSTNSLSSTNFNNSKYLQGYLLKKKRKRLQGFTKRFFILNFKYNTLSYYLNENSLKVRGEMQINISSVSAFKDDYTIVVDSGMEIWVLKTLNKLDWENWINAFDFIKLNSHQQLESLSNISLDSNSPFSIKEEEEEEEDKSNELIEIYTKLQNLKFNDLIQIENDLSEIKSFIRDKISSNSSILSSKSSSTSLNTYYDAEDNVHILTGIQTTNSQISIDELSSDDFNSTVESNFIISDEIDLYPLPIIETIKRRNDIYESTTIPQSLFQFIRKNVGKDLSTISMPVTSNEPLTILQKIAEFFEYSNLLNSAIDETNLEIKLIKISIFAISNLSNLRSKTRNLRKPFNPILGETFEFVDNLQKIRFIGEKVQHKPYQIFAFHIDSQDWECEINLLPEQKFWGKSIELNNKGQTILKFKKTGEIFKWTQPTTILKNIIVGDKYCEPIDSINITSSIGLKSNIEFKKNSNGVFNSSKSEDVLIKLSNSIVNEMENKTEYFAQGKWTSSIFLKSSNNSQFEKQLWKVNPLLPKEDKKWGFNEFSSNLNEITSIEDGFIPKTDSRLRPDVQAYEKGDVSLAETLKLEIEQRQRDRRNKLNQDGIIHKPQWFEKIGDLEYHFKKGNKSYWNVRKSQNWDKNLEDLW
ncbi:hypothetical protein WICMUC_002745 [Wickerhamomyces mucosus]|uniref:PH domain-containing protein n=1 Tax=Wickerhamomyces mucosus TaxID=1378264 RepID=A0A9P8TEJ2_9ASCO|nr:hypothetical protein WICMUC_002745 [Wickerhamomyces mucosus]